MTPEEKLRALRDQLERIAPYPWSNVLTWAAGTRPLIRTHFGEHLQDFETAVAEPRPAMIPYSSVGITPWSSDADRRRAKAEEEHVDAQEDAVNRANAMDARARILAFIDGVLAANDVAERARNSARLAERGGARSEELDRVLTAREHVQMPDPKKVFVIHGRNLAAKRAVDQFLRSLKLDSIDFDELAASMGTEFVGNIVVEGLKRAQGIVALFTPDEYSVLLPAHREVKEAGSAVRRWQARPNVIFEAGIAFGIARERTVLATVGSDVALFSDVNGIHVVRLDNTVANRGKFRKKLIGAGCEVDTHSDEWTDHQRSGDFDASLAPLQGVSPRDPF